MSGGTIGLLIGLGTGALFLLWAWPRFDVRQLFDTCDRSPPEEPCWTGQISADGRFSCGRYGCCHPDLAAMDARARSGEFGAYG